MDQKQNNFELHPQKENEDYALSSDPNSSFANDPDCFLISEHMPNSEPIQSNQSSVIFDVQWTNPTVQQAVGKAVRINPHENMLEPELDLSTTSEDTSTELSGKPFNDRGLYMKYIKYKNKFCNLRYQQKVSKDAKKPISSEKLPHMSITDSGEISTIKTEDMIDMQKKIFGLSEISQKNGVIMSEEVLCKTSVTSEDYGNKKVNINNGFIRSEELFCVTSEDCTNKKSNATMSKTSQDSTITEGGCDLQEINSPHDNTHNYPIIKNGEKLYMMVPKIQAHRSECCYYETSSFEINSTSKNMTKKTDDEIIDDIPNCSNEVEISDLHIEI